MYKATSRAIMALLILVVLVSCQQLFTTSLGTAFARDSYPDLSDIPLEDALLYMADAKADPSLATALIAPLYEAALDADPGSATYDQAATALVDAVVISSGIGPAMTDGLEMYLNNEDLDLDALLGSITVSASAVTSLRLVADNPPESMTATQAYTAAATLLVSIVQATPDLDLETAEIADFDPDDPVYAAALALFDHAQTLEANTLGAGETSMFGEIFGDLPF